MIENTSIDLQHHAEDVRERLQELEIEGGATSAELSELADERAAVRESLAICLQALKTAHSRPVVDLENTVTTERPAAFARTAGQKYTVTVKHILADGGSQLSARVYGAKEVDRILPAIFADAEV